MKLYCIVFIGSVQSGEYYYKDSKNTIKHDYISDNVPNIITKHTRGILDDRNPMYLGPECFWPGGNNFTTFHENYVIQRQGVIFNFLRRHESKELFLADEDRIMKLSSFFKYDGMKIVTKNYNCPVDFLCTIKILWLSASKWEDEIESQPKVIRKFLPWEVSINDKNETVIVHRFTDSRRSIWFNKLSYLIKGTLSIEQTLAGIKVFENEIPFEQTWKIHVPTINKHDFNRLPDGIFGFTIYENKPRISSNRMIFPSSPYHPMKIRTIRDRYHNIKVNN